MLGPSTTLAARVRKTAIVLVEIFVSVAVNTIAVPNYVGTMLTRVGAVSLAFD